MYSFQAFQNIFKIQEFIWITSKKITIPLSLINFFAVFWNQANRTLTILLTALKLLAPLNITEQKHYTFFSSSIFLVFGVSFFQINSKIIETIEIIIKSLTFLERYWDELTFFLLIFYSHFCHIRRLKSQTVWELIFPNTILIFLNK